MGDYRKNTDSYGRHPNKLYGWVILITSLLGLGYFSRRIAAIVIAFFQLPSPARGTVSVVLSLLLSFAIHVPLAVAYFFGAASGYQYRESRNYLKNLRRSVKLALVGSSFFLIASVIINISMGKKAIQVVTNMFSLYLITNWIFTAILAFCYRKLTHPPITNNEINTEKDPAGLEENDESAKKMQ